MKTPRWQPARPYESCKNVEESAPKIPCCAGCQPKFASEVNIALYQLDLILTASEYVIGSNRVSEGLRKNEKVLFCWVLTELFEHLENMCYAHSI